ncbi:LLM class flavin-dependent oxidoreductase [Nocardia xishanensis]|uniref:LLM class flavin-dependent oxidoreductase n=1 Tax=Nocardia xishanensis TaxID=238964 RepID=A0ABW7XBR3_9NOCA
MGRSSSPSISCAFPPGPDTPAHIALAEELGYRNAWLYDSPVLYDDVWATLALAAQRTERIGLGTGIAVGALRHVTVTASAVAMIERLAPGRMTLGLGAGGTGMMMLGQRPLKWKFVAAYADTVRKLLRGEAVTWEGASIKLDHPTIGVPLPARDVPILMGVEGPRGEQTAQEHADGVISGWHTPQTAFDWACRLMFGTVLDDGESPISERAILAAGPGAAPIYHLLYTQNNRAALEALPGGAEWAAEIDTVPEEERIRAIWSGHLVQLTKTDLRHIPPEFIAQSTYTGTKDEVRAKVDAVASEHGFTEIIYQPSGPDIPRELRAFADAVM